MLFVFKRSFFIAFVVTGFVQSGEQKDKLQVLVNARSSSDERLQAPKMAKHSHSQIPVRVMLSSSNQRAVGAFLASQVAAKSRSSDSPVRRVVAVPVVQSIAKHQDPLALIEDRRDTPQRTRPSIGTAEAELQKLNKQMEKAELEKKAQQDAERAAARH